VDNRNEIRDFLTSRRARIRPEQAGLPAYGGSRRVSGLRREEVALLAGVSIDYYVRLERGNLHGVSKGVLEAVAQALQLNEAERAHLIDLAGAANTTTRTRRQRAQHVRPSLQRILDAITGAAAYVRNERLDILAANQLGHALFSEWYADPARPVNHARFVFLNPRASEFYVDWESVANDAVGILRAAAGRDPHDRSLSDLVGELSTQSEAFRTRWAAHNVRFHRSGLKRFHHPVVGGLELTYEAMELPADPGLSLVTYTADAGSTSQDRLKFLGSWSATLDQLGQAETAHPSDREAPMRRAHRETSNNEDDTGQPGRKSGPGF
jgi:transcriptional regulator with XRE-family HTH domain